MVRFVLKGQSKGSLDFLGSRPMCQAARETTCARHGPKSCWLPGSQPYGGDPFSPPEIRGLPFSGLVQKGEAEREPLIYSFWGV